MANVKSVSITGLLPFTAHEHRRMCSFIGFMSSPTFCLRLTYDMNQKPTMIPNDFGGQTANYKYEVCGQEAVSEGFLNELLQAIVDCGGTVKTAKYRDVENQTDWFYLAVPQPSKETNFICTVEVNCPKMTGRQIDAARPQIMQLFKDAVISGCLDYKGKIPESIKGTLFNTNKTSISLR